MKKLMKTSLLLLGMMVAFAGCDSAAEKIENAKELANVDFGDFDMDGLTEKFAGVTSGFKDVSADNVGGLTSKISDLTGSLDGLGIGKLKGGAKLAVGTAIATFGDAIEKAMGGISDKGILGKLKPVVDSLLEKLKGFK